MFGNFFKVTCYGVQLVSNHLVIYTSLASFQYIFCDHCLKFTLLTNRFEIQFFLNRYSACDLCQLVRIH